MSNELIGYRALVTGGTAGIGLACTRLLTQAGASVVFTGRDRRRGESIAAQLGAAQFRAADMADLDEVRAMAQEVGPVDILVNNAAYFPGSLTVNQDPAAFDTAFSTNVRGAYFLVAALVPHMLAQGGGSIVNITSMVAFKGVPGASTYSASKAALESLTRSWSAEFGGSGVRVNSVAPGPTNTEGVRAEWGDTNDELGRALPLGRTAEPDEIAEAVLFLSSPRAKFITGSTLHVDGGGSAV